MKSKKNKGHWKLPKMYFKTTFVSIFGGLGSFHHTDNLKLLSFLVRPSGNCSPTHIILVTIYFTHFRIFRSFRSIQYSGNKQYYKLFYKSFKCFNLLELMLKHRSLETLNNVASAGSELCTLVDRFILLGSRMN